MIYAIVNVVTGELLQLSNEPLEVSGAPLQVRVYDIPMPDMTKFAWERNILAFVPTRYATRFLTPTEFMRRFTMNERLSIRGLEREGDLVIIDAMALMNGTKEGVNLDDPDVVATLGYLTHKGVIPPERIGEILE